MSKKYIDCDQCDREHLAPPPPPEGYNSFALPLMKSRCYQQQLRQWISDNVAWRRSTGCEKQWWGPTIQH